MTVAFRSKFHKEVLDVDLEVWMKSGPDDIQGRVFICKEELQAETWKQQKDYP